MSISQTPPQNTSSKSSFMIPDQVSGRHICLSRQMVQRLQATRSVQINVQGPDGKGRYNARIVDTTNTASPLSMFTTTFIYDSENDAETAMRNVLNKVKDILL